MNLTKLKTLLLLLCFAMSGAAHAQAYPTKPVRIIVPNAPGGAADILARLIGQRLTPVFGQAFFVDNRPSAGGIAAADAGAHAPADGHHLFISDIQTVAINPFMFSKLPYDPAKDFTPITLAVTLPLYLAVHPSVPAKNLAELAALAKAQPGKLSYGSSGIGSIHHITMESIKSALGMDILHVPYRGGGQSVAAALTGEVSLAIAALPALAPHVKSDKVRLIAVTTLKRSSHAPDVPAVSELVPGFDMSSEIGFVAPRGTPAPIVGRLSTEIRNTLKDPEVLERMNSLGLIPIGSTPDEYTENIRKNLEKFAKAVKISGAKAE